ncbi:MAG: hypothetical protein WBB98_17635 [Xanthobacteraceae bacterium]
MPSASSLADLPRQTIANWHRFVATGDQALLASLLAEDVVFRSRPFTRRFPANQRPCWF